MAPELRVAMLSLHSCPLGKPGTRDTGGMSVYVRQVSRCLGKLGIAVDVFTSHPHPELPPVVELGENTRLIHLPSEQFQESGKMGLFPHLADLACAAHTFGKEQSLEYHLVHSHYWLSGCAGQILADWWKVPHVVMLHTSARAKNRALKAEVEPELRSESEEKLLASASLIIAATAHEKNDLVDLYGAPKEKITVIPCGVDLEMFRPLPREQARSRLGLASKRIVLYVGRIEVEKGIALLLEATAILSEEDRPSVIIVGEEEGDADEVDRLRLLSERLGLARHIEFRKAVEQQELPLYYSAADLCVFPSHYETFGLTAVEALACGTPVITSPVGVMAEANRPAGVVLLKERSSAVLGALLYRMLKDSDLLARMAKDARSSVQDLSWPLVAEKVAARYRTLVPARRTDR